jgi:gas vesicle protein
MERTTNRSNRANGENRMSRKTEDALALLAGAAIGTAAMFLFDPQSGPRRRRQLGALTREAWDITGETVGPALGSVASGASRIGRSVSETLGEYGARLAETGSRAASHGSHYLADAGESISEGSRALWHRGKRLVGAEEESHFPVGRTAAIGGVGLIALGALGYWFFEPRRGPQHRQRIMRVLRDAGDLARKTGRHISNRARGAYAETRSYVGGREPVTDEQLIARVRSELGRVISNMSNVSVTAVDGYVTLIGTLPQDEIPNAEACAKAVHGVRDLNVQLQPHVAQPL